MLQKRKIICKPDDIRKPNFELELKCDNSENCTHQQWLDHFFPIGNHFSSPKHGGFRVAEHVPLET